jgi:hypothetical protein
MSTLIGTAPDQVPVNGMLGKAAFLNQDVPFSGALKTIQTAPTIASATTIAPTALITFVSGTTSIATITPPTSLLTTGGQIILIPTGLWATTTAGNISLVVTATVGEALIFTYDATTAKWYPSVSDTMQNLIVANLTATSAAAPTIASATTIAPTKAITFISGVTPIVTITAPSPISLGGGHITLIPIGIFTTTTAGNIALASTAIVSKALIMTYDATTLKWYPSY